MDFESHSLGTLSSAAAQDAGYPEPSMRFSVGVLILSVLSSGCVQSGVRPGAIDWGAADVGQLDADASVTVELPPVPTDTCIPTNGSIEICDFVDNNCDGNIDENLPPDGMACDDGDRSDESETSSICSERSYPDYGRRSSDGVRNISY